MKRVFELGAVVALAVVVLGTASPAQAKGKPPAGGGSGSCVDSTADIKVTSIIVDTDDLGQPFQVQSDGGGAYVSYKSGSDQLESVVQGDAWCDWELNVSASVSRGISATLAYPTSEAWPAPPFVGPQVVGAARIISKCWQNDVNKYPGEKKGISMGNMTDVGQTILCPFLLQMDLGDGSTHSLQMYPIGSPLSDWIEITCTGAESGLCNAWTVKPQAKVDSSTGELQVNPAGQVAAVGELIKWTSSRGKSIRESLGYYYVSFSVTVHK